jgi:hypothetical protein
MDHRMSRTPDRHDPQDLDDLTGPVIVAAGVREPDQAWLRASGAIVLAAGFQRRGPRGVLVTSSPGHRLTGRIAVVDMLDAPATYNWPPMSKEGTEVLTRRCTSWVVGAVVPG